MTAIEQRKNIKFSGFLNKSPSESLDMLTTDGNDSMKNSQLYKGHEGRSRVEDDPHKSETSGRFIESSVRLKFQFIYHTELFHGSVPSKSGATSGQLIRKNLGR